MRVLSLLTLIAFTSSCKAASNVLNTDTTNIANLDVAILTRADVADHEKRSLRWHQVDERYDVDFNDDVELSEIDSDDEERAGISTNIIDDAVNKVDDTLLKVVPAVRKIPSQWSIALTASATNRVRTLYPKGLSKSTMDQVLAIEKQRLKDWEDGVQMVKSGPYAKTQREIKMVGNIKESPLLESRLGRDLQKYADEKRTIREMACIVASRRPEQGGGDVLLISSSNPKKMEWLLPKGGHDTDETITNSALRELVEEGGVGGTIMHNLGTKNVKIGKNEDVKRYVYNSYWVMADDVFDQWPESVRYRMWVSFDEAEKLLKKRPDMIDIVRTAREKAKLVESGELSEMDATLSKIKLVIPKEQETLTARFQSYINSFSKWIKGYTDKSK